MSKISIVPFIFATAILLSLGCGGLKMPDNMGTLYPVSLTLTQENKPLAGANVMLISDNANAPYSTGGVSNEQGIVTVYTDGRFPGSNAGHYKITVTKIEMEEIPPAPNNLESNEYKEWSKKYGNRAIKNWNNVEKIYGNSQTTPLEITVEKGKNNISLDCGKAIHDAL